MQGSSAHDGRIHQIDALRGIAALLVAAIFHQHYLTGLHRTGPLDGLPVFTWLHEFGWTMVDLFFVISGFIFAHVYLRDGRMQTGAGDFAIARVARLYPLHLITLLAAAAILLLGQPAIAPSGKTDLWHFGLNLLMLQESGLNRGHNFNLPAWSISVEVYCYVLFYCVARWLSRWLVPVGLVIIALSLLATMGKEPTIDHVARGFCGFFTGVLIQRLRRPLPWWLLAPLAVVPLVLIGMVSGISKGAVLAVSAYPALVLLAPRMMWLAWAPFQWLGSRSYSIYLVHTPIFWTINVVVFGGKKLDATTALAALALALPVVLLAAHVSFRYLEDPARRAIRALFSGRQTRSQT